MLPLSFTVRWQMVSYGPLLDRTHQGWKQRASNFGALLGTLIMVATLWRFHYLSHGGVIDRSGVIYLGISCVIIAASLYISFGTIRCPVCGNRWIWRAARQRSPPWLTWLRAQQTCPACGSSGELLPNNRWSGP